MTVTPMFHYGILVQDIEAAMERFGDLMGFTFHEPTTVHLNRLADPVEHQIEFRATYSRQGPPFMELMEMAGDGIYASRHGEGIHHIGLWDPNIEMNRARLTGHHHLRPEATVLTPNGSAFAWFSDPASSHGVRLEFIDAEAREPLEHWINSGVMVGGFDI
jgi:hypothetical protein